MFNLNTKFIIPKILKNLLPDNIYKPKYLKDFIIVSMLRNYIITNPITHKDFNSLVMNKYLITKQIDTNNLTVKTTKTYKQNNSAESFNCEIFRVVVHLNNSFNPTNISLLSNENQIHVYQLEGDLTLHVNLNLKTFFNILTNEADLVEIKKSCKDYTLSNSKLSWIVSQLIVGNPITYYEKDSSNNWVEADLYKINETDQTFGSGYYFDSETETFWKFELGDILIFYHNLWWSSILIMFYLYNLPVWGGKSDPDKNTNKFRLKASILQLLGGFSKVHMLENIQRSIKEHYAIVDKNFFLIKDFEKELTKVEGSLDSNYFISAIQKLFLETTNSLQLTNDLITGVSQTIINNQLDLVDVDNYESDFILSSNDISKLNKKNIKLNFTQSDHISLNDSFKEFKINYKFNNLLIYLLSLELIIKIIYENIKLKIESKTYNENYLNILENILLVAIINYFKVINEFNSIIETKTLQLEVPANFPNPFNKYHKNCYCDHINKNTNTFTLLLSNYKINYNLYTTSELKTFCGNYCSNSNSIFSSKNNNTVSTINFNNPKREFSTSSLSRVNLEIKNNNLLENMQDNSKIKNKNVNYSKSIFSILEKIRELTKNKNYDPQIVQLKIENFWSDILK